MPSYTRHDGFLNLAAHYPLPSTTGEHKSFKPDLGNLNIGFRVSNADPSQSQVPKCISQRGTCSVEAPRHFI